MTRLTIERLFSSPSLSGSVPVQVRFSPDGKYVTFLANPPEDRERLDLYGYDVASGATNRLIDTGQVRSTAEPTAVEKAERERRRQFTRGISSYRWLPDARRICCVIDGAIKLFDCADRTLSAVTAEGLRQTAVTVSPRGGFLSYVRSGDLYTFDLNLEREDRLTYDASEAVTNGLAEFVAQEEMHRFEGHWWSPDDTQLLFARVDSSTIAPTSRYEFTANHLVAVSQRYPYAGSANAEVELRAVDLHTRRIRTIDYRIRPDDYLARVNVGAAYAAVQTQSRDQRTLTLTAHPLNGAAPRQLLTERQPAWVNLHNNFRFVGDEAFVWTSERSGSSRLYLYDADATAIELSGSQGRINEVVHADSEHAFVLGWMDDPTEQHLFRVSFDSPGHLDQLTKIRGWHEAIIDATGTWFVDRYSNAEQPPCLAIESMGSEPNQRRSLSANALIEGHPYHEYLDDHATASLGRIPAADGQDLWYRLTLPRHRDPQNRIPVLVNVYGGPGVQRVRNEWTSLTNQLFAGLGIAVFELDNRGGTNRAKAFEDAIHGRLGYVEVEDQLNGIEFLKHQPWVDAARIGVIGHSYGGFMTLMLMAHSRAAIRAGVSTAPVTDWRLYDTYYTERYLQTPETNADGYRASCALSYVNEIRGGLLLMHGMADDNVLFGNSSALMQALQNRQFPFELMLYPGAKHALQERDVAIHRYQTILDFLQRKLLS